MHHSDTIFEKSVQLLTDDNNIIRCTKRDITATFDRQSIKMGLAVNEGKTKYMLSIRRGMWYIDSQITANNYTFATVKEFIYLGFGDTSLETGLSRQLNTRDLSCTTKSSFPCFFMVQRHGYYLAPMQQRKVLCRLFGLVQAGDEIDALKRFNIQRLR